MVHRELSYKIMTSTLNCDLKFGKAITKAKENCVSI